MRKQTKIEKLALRLTDLVGSPLSLLLHSLFFIVIFALMAFGWTFQDILLILTTVVSLEAIYLSILIQMTVNLQNHRLKGVEKDIDDILEDTEELTGE